MNVFGLGEPGKLVDPTYQLLVADVFRSVPYVLRDRHDRLERCQLSSPYYTYFVLTHSLALPRGMAMCNGIVLLRDVSLSHISQSRFVVVGPFWLGEASVAEMSGSMAFRYNRQCCQLRCEVWQVLYLRFWLEARTLSANFSTAQDTTFLVSRPRDYQI